MTGPDMIPYCKEDPEGDLACVAVFDISKPETRRHSASPDRQPDNRLLGSIEVHRLCGSCCLKKHIEN